MCRQHSSKTSEYFHSLRTIDSPLTWKELNPILVRSADIQRAVWESRASNPSVDDLQRGFRGSTKYWPDLNIVGGAPIWLAGQTSQWGERFYKPGPF
jgi:hypothetical protein